MLFQHPIDELPASSKLSLRDEGAFAPQLGEMEPGTEARELVSKLEEGGRPLDPNDRYMCARFVQHLMKRRPE